MISTFHISNLNSNIMNTKVVIVSAPSGTGKSTLIGHLMTFRSDIAFSVSATNRAPRGKEQNGVDYHFLSTEEFQRHIEQNDFLEYVEVYGGRFYGSLKQQVNRQLEDGKHVIFDVDVVGAQKIKEYYGDRALSVFIQPPSIESLRQRLEQRATDAPEVIEDRLARARFELSQAEKFDQIVVNDDLETAKKDFVALISEFLDKP